MAARSNMKGFTLIEMLLVLIIISIIIYASLGYVQQKALQMRMDRTSVQMQQILNAGLAYYVFNGKWPVQLSDLQGPPPAPTYLPPTITSPWGSSYQIAATSQLFYVFTPITVVSSKGAYAAASVIAGTLPLAYTSTDNGSPPTTPPSSSSSCTASSTTCNVVASVNIPGQNLNNATAVNFAGLYHHGGCVPVPTCPVDNTSGTSMTPQVMVVPVSVSGVNTTNQTQAYPINSFTGYATTDAGNVLDNTPLSCKIAGGPAQVATACGIGGSGVPSSTNQYWRVCLQVVTEQGDVSQTNTGTGTSAWGGNVTLMAITRCAINNEASGSDFSIYSR